MDLNKYKMSGVKITSVPHCTEAGLISVCDGKWSNGQPIGWCHNEELGLRARPGGTKFSAIRVFHSAYGECWGHVMTQHLKTIFGELENV